jgi:hypothetical protein
MRIRPTCWCGLIAVSSLFSATTTQAQFYSNPNQQQQGGTRGNTGGTGGTGGSGSSSMFGGSGSNGSAAFGSSGTGQQGLGQIGFGNTNSNRNNTGTQGPNGFLGVNNNTNNFLGRNTQGQQANQNQNGQRGNRGQRGMDQELQNILNGNGQFGGNNANATKSTGVRPRQKVAFEHPTLQSPAVVTKITDRFGKLATRFPHLKGVDLSVDDDGVIVLRGAVDSENSARVTESLVRLEPGVKNIRSELTYPPPAAAE